METTRATKSVVIDLESVIATSELAERIGKHADYQAVLVSFQGQKVILPPG